MDKSDVFTLRHVAGPFGDATCNYDIILKKECTVKEFIEAVLTDDREWGDICIGHIFEGPRCEYRYGKLLSELPDEYLSAVIESGWSNGGWSSMTYVLMIK